MEELEREIALCVVDEDSFDEWCAQKKAVQKAPEAAMQLDALAGKANYELLFALENWYEQLKEHTAKSVFVELSDDDVTTLTQHFRKRDIAVDAIVQRLDDAIKSEFGDAGCFVKLHTRSPKDAVVRIDGPIVEILEQRMSPYERPRIGVEKAEQRIANEDCILLSTLARELFRVSSGRDILDLFSKSSRVISDLQKAQDAHRGSTIVLREFTLCAPESEFRVFFCKGNLTGISQYCYSQFFPNLLKQKTEIERLIVDFFKSVTFPFDSFVCDVVVLLNAKVFIIEFNPWFNDTGALLFSWKSETDRAILRGDEPMQFRVCTEMESHPYSCIPYEFREWFQEKRGMMESAGSNEKKEKLKWRR